MIRSVAVIALNGFRESRRNRVTVVIGLFAIALILSAWLLSSAAVTTVDRVLVDGGLGAMAFMLVALTVYLSSGLLGKEIERKTIFLVLGRPLSRGVFLFGRFAGVMLTITVLLVVMLGIFLLELVVFRVPVGAPVVLAGVMLWFELLIVAGLGMAMSSRAGQMVSLFVTGAIYFAGHLSRDIYFVSQKASDGLLRVVGKAVYYILPNFERLNYRPYAAYGSVPAAGDTFSAMTYAVLYTAAMLCLAILLFQKRDFK